jgi:hypothetical protein
MLIIQLKTTVAAAEAMLDVEFHTFSGIFTDRQLTKYSINRLYHVNILIRFMGEATLPNKLAQHVELIAGLSEFIGDKNTKVDLAFPKSKSTRVGAKYDVDVTPQLLKEYYGIPAGLNVTNSTNLQGIAAFDDYFSIGSLAAFVEEYNLLTPNVTRFGPDCATGEYPCVFQVELSIFLYYRTKWKVILTSNLSLVWLKMPQPGLLTKLLNTGSYNLPTKFSIT